MATATAGDAMMAFESRPPHIPETPTPILLDSRESERGIEQLASDAGSSKRVKMAGGGEPVETSPENEGRGSRQIRENRQ